MKNNEVNHEDAIGDATMDEEGTVILHLRAEGPNVVGRAIISYRSDDPKYKQILEHLGDLRPGEHKAVRPWT